MTKILFIGDIVGEPGLAFLEAHLPELIVHHGAQLVIANAENIHLEHHPNGPCGLTGEEIERLFALGVNLVTGGNHSWDGPEGISVHDDLRVLRPLNAGSGWPGRGAAVTVSRDGFRLGVVNLAGRSAIPRADDPVSALERQLEVWRADGAVDAVLVDHHGESVFEKITLAYAFAGQIAALLGTHTHVPTPDARLLEGGVAYVSDVGMTGPGGGAQGYDPAAFVASARSQGFQRPPMRLSSGPVELGAVLVTLNDARAVRIERVEPS
jgi:metallophosphoesterase (TIGR00282 family)